MDYDSAADYVQAAAAPLGALTGALEQAAPPLEPATSVPPGGIAGGTALRVGVAEATVEPWEGES